MTWPQFAKKPSSVIVINPSIKYSPPLVANEHDDHVGAGVLPGIFQPRRQVVERVSSAKDKLKRYFKEYITTLLSNIIPEVIDMQNYYYYYYARTQFACMNLLTRALIYTKAD